MEGEAELIERARNGSVEDFTELVRRYRERLLRFLLSRSASHADAEDALQDTLINAYKYLHSYDSRWRFSTWLYRIAINNAARLRRPETAEVGELEDEEQGPLQLCMAEAERENLWSTARRLLNEDCYAALWLRYVEDMSVKDIAAVVERSVSWVKVNLMRSRQVLEAELNAGLEVANDG